MQKPCCIIGDRKTKLHTEIDYEYDTNTLVWSEPGQLSRYSDGLRAGRPGFDLQQRPDRLCGPLSFLSNGCWDLFSGG
jgi:hypothetical protein